MFSASLYSANVHPAGGCMRPTIQPLLRDLRWAGPGASGLREAVRLNRSTTEMAAPPPIFLPPYRAVSNRIDHPVGSLQMRKARPPSSVWMNNSPVRQAERGQANRGTGFHAS